MHILRKGLLLLLIALAGLNSGCTAGRTAFNKAEKLEQMGQYDDAVMKYAEAVSANPNLSEYRLRFLKSSETAARTHMKRADELFAQKKYDDAFREYQVASTLDPSLERAKQQSDLLIKQRTALVYLQEAVTLEKENKYKESVRAYQKALGISADLQEAKEGLERLAKVRKTKLDGFELNLKSNKPITLKFKDAKIKEVFNIITQLSGINFVFDEAVKDTNVTIYLENATFQQALDILTGLHKLGKKALNESTVIVYPKTPDKIKQYEELYVQTFYLNKLDAKKAVNLVRTMLQVKKIYVNEEMNALVIRDTPDVLEVTRKIIEANDIPDAEVLLEVEVIELAKKNAETFGLALSRYAVSAVASNSGTLLSDVLTQPTTTSTTTTSSATTTTNLLNLFRYKGYDTFITVPNATFNFGKTMANGETLSNPKIRVKNREKSKFNVGTRVPITTTSTNGTVGGLNVNVQYVDVGVKVSAEPTIQINNEINIKLSLEVSSILSREKIGDGNTTVATIGTRNLDTVLSLKDGETSMIGGLIQDIKSKNTSRVFLLGDIPVLGTLLSNHDGSNDKTELILAITPRIIRSVTIPEGEVATFWSGVEDDPSIGKSFASFVQEPEYAVPASSGGAAQQAQAVVKPGPPKEQPVQPVAKPSMPVTQPQQPQVVPIDKTAPIVPEPVVAIPPTPQPATPPPAPVQPPVSKISLTIAAPASVKMNEQFKVDVMVKDANNLSSAPFSLAYDPAYLELIGTSEGELLKKDGKPTLFASKVDKNLGQVSVNLSRIGEVEGVSGGGSLISALFKAKSQGSASLGFIGVKFTGPGGKQLDAIPYNSVIEIK
jgi:general secretion pathway protein D